MKISQFAKNALQATVIIHVWMLNGAKIKVI